MAIFAISVTLGIVAVIGQLWKFTFFAPNLISMMGLAVGIDYSLFIVSRYREERRKGGDKAACDRPLRRHGEPRGLLQRPDGGDRALGHAPGPDDDLPGPRGRRHHRGAGLGRRVDDAPAGGPEPAGNPGQAGGCGLARLAVDVEDRERARALRHDRRGGRGRDDRIRGRSTRWSRRGGGSARIRRGRHRSDEAGSAGSRRGSPGASGTSQIEQGRPGGFWDRASRAVMARPGDQPRCSRQAS